MAADKDFGHLDPDRRVGVEARKSYALKLQDGFIQKYLSGGAILDIGYRGYEDDVVPIVPQAIGVDLDYPGYDGRTLPFADGSQDAVFSSHCLEHADDCRAAIAEWFRVLKTDGFLIIAVPHKYLYERRLTPPSRWNADHRRFFTPATLLLRIEEALPPNSYRIRHLVDNDFGYVYSIPPDSHPGGCCEIEVVVQKVAPPPWQLENPLFQEKKSAAAAVRVPSETTEHKTKKLRVVFDGLNLALPRGTGIATYTRMLMRVLRDLGNDVRVVYETPFAPPANGLLQDVLFFDALGKKKPLPRKSRGARLAETVRERLARRLSVKPAAMRLGDTVDARQFPDLVASDGAFAAQNIFQTANRYFHKTGRFVDAEFASPPDIFHCTYPMPLHSKNSCNIYTIHDLVPLRLPYGTLDNKRRIYRLLKAIAQKADHIVTVSETSKRDIAALLDVEENRVTNTYQAVAFPDEYLTRPDEEIEHYLSGSFGLEMHGYLLFFGAIEPKKNVGRLIDAYLSSGAKQPLVLVTGGGWQNESELRRMDEHSARAVAESDNGPRIHRLDYLSASNLVNLIRGARAVVFPSLLEGFGLPVLEAMTLGAPVVTSNTGALAEIAGDAALLIDPYDVDAITQAIRKVALDIDLCGELSQRGLVQAEKFSLFRYRERVAALYNSLV